MKPILVPLSLDIQVYYTQKAVTVHLNENNAVLLSISLNDRGELYELAETDTATIQTKDRVILCDIKNNRSEALLTSGITNEVGETQCNLLVCNGRGDILYTGIFVLNVLRTVTPYSSQPGELISGFEKLVNDVTEARNEAVVAVIDTGQAETEKLIEAAESKKNEMFADLKEKIDSGDYRGEKGEKGLKGDTGLQGVQGLKGDMGVQGIQGERGEKGTTGERGLQGLQGVKGDTGEQGATGAKGEKGDPGIQGLTGAQGVQGSQGAKGDIGLAGAKGDKGDTGAQGIKGDTGSKGDKGDRGEDGVGAITSLAHGFFALSVNSNGDLLMTHNSDEPPPNLRIENGELIYEFI